MREAVIVSGVRTAGGKAPRGVFRDTRPEVLGKYAIQETIKRAGGSFTADMIDDVLWGCATPEQACGNNVARITSLYAGIPLHVPNATINRFCSSGLQCISFAAESIMANRCDIVLAGGVEHMSMVPMGGVRRPNPEILEDPELDTIYTAMGVTAEIVAERYNISREDQDRFGAVSMQKAAAATLSGKFKEEIVPVPVKITTLGPDGKPVTKEVLVDTDEGIRYDASYEANARLRPAFKPQGGVVTAGNASQTTDGAAAVLVMSKEKAQELGCKPRLKYLGYAVAGCRPEEMGIGPVYAVPKVLKRLGLELKDIGLIELNEDFASQALYCIKTLGLNEEIVNVNGGAIALGHPMGATGAKLTVTLMHEMERRQVKYGMVTMCIGGGQGAAGVFELCQ
jgi:acetyl-CoA acyltransferase